MPADRVEARVVGQGSLDRCLRRGRRCRSIGAQGSFTQNSLLPQEDFMRSI